MRRLGLVGWGALVVLLVLDVALVVLVVRDRSQPDASPGTTLTTVTSDVSSDPAATQPSPATSVSNGIKAAPATTATTAPPRDTVAMLSVVDAGVAWRATRGSCATGGATVSRSTDSGMSWEPVQSQPFGALVRLDATSATKAFVVGAKTPGATATGCAVNVRSTTNTGGAWSPPSTVAKSWARDLQDADTMHTTKGQKVKPCGDLDVVAFARTSDAVGQVVCADGSTRRSTDSGALWVAGPKATGMRGSDILGFTVTGGGAPRWVVATQQKGCIGVQILTAKGDAGTFGRAECVKAELPLTQVALATEQDRPDFAWLLVGGRLQHASGDLTSWTSASP